METSLFILCLISLIGWNAYRRQAAFWSGFFYFTLILWAGSMIVLPSTNKWIHLSVDLITIGVISLFFSRLFRRKPLLLISSLIPIFIGHMIFVSIIGHQDVEIKDIDLDGEFLVELSHINDLESLENAIGEDFVSLEKAFYPTYPSKLDNYYVIDIKNRSRDQYDILIKTLSHLEFVNHVEYNEMYRVEPPAIDPLKLPRITPFTNDPGLKKQWHLEHLKASQIHHFILNNKPQKKTLLAILDTGVDSEHEDLLSRYRSVDERSDYDDVGHGTHCAGIAAAVSNNKVGVASMLPTLSNVEITGIKVLKLGGAGTQKDIIAGIIKATDQGADVISLSLGGVSSDSRQEAYKIAIEYAAEKNVIAVVASGNNGGNAKYITPANVPGVIVVSAVNQNLRLANFSNYLTDIKLGIAAPGVSIYSTTPNNKYAAFNGTSMATPIVAGTIAILKSYQPDLTIHEVYDLINTTGLSLGEDEKTGRLIQPHAALQQLGNIQ